MQKLKGFIEQLEAATNNEHVRAGRKSQWAKGFRSDPEKAIASAKDTVYTLSPSNRDNFEGVAELAVGDTGVANDEIPNAIRGAIDAQAAFVMADIDSIYSAYEQSRDELVRASEPFQDQISQASLTRYMSELGLTGGVGETKQAVLRTAQKALSTVDDGAASFWARNLDRALQNAGGALDRNLEKEVRGLLQKAVDRGRTHEQRKAYESLQRLENAWVSHGMEGAKSVAEYACRNAVNYCESIEPRERTENEKQTAASKQKIREGAAKLRQGGNVDIEEVVNAVLRKR